MRLARLDLVRFGHFSDFSLDLGGADSPGFHVILGRNEAGKSTLVEAWLNLLYGIPINTSYAFRHPRSTLEIRAMVDDGAGPVSLTRTAQRANNLLDAGGAPVPPATLKAMLRGVSDEAYRALYCLDDETIEKGGEDILASQGDLGRLLFAGASGMQAFNADLEAERAADRAFQRRGQGRQSTEVFTAKKRLEELKRERDAIDLSAADYRRLRREAEAAAAADAEARDRHAMLLREEGRLKARLLALPVLADRAEMAARLAELGDLPAVPDGAEEEIARLAKQRTEHQSTLRTRWGDLEARTAERAGIVVDEAAAALPGQLAELAGLRGRAAADAEDLPRRRDEAETRRGAATRILRDLAMPDLDPAKLHLPRPKLEALDRAVKARDLAAQRANQTRSELAKCQEALAAAAEKAKTVEESADGDPGPLRDLLADGTLRMLAEDLADAKRTRDDTAAAARAAREALAVGTVAFSACPQVPLTPDAAQALAERLRDLENRAAQIRDRLVDDCATIAKAEARAAVLTGQGGDVSDQVAAEARTRRDELWQAHRKALTGPTADAFEAALADEDALTAQRLADGARLAELRQLDVGLAEAAAEQTRREETLAATEAELAAARQELSGHLAAIGLPPTMGAAALETWLTDHARAAAAERAERDAAGSLARLEQDAEPGWLALKAALGPVAPDDPGALVRAAEERLRDLETREERRDTARRSLRDAEAALAQRSNAAEAADLELSAAGDELQRAADALDLALPDGLYLSDALPLLRELAAECAELASLTERIAKLERNAADFAASVARIATPWPDLADQPPLAQAIALDGIATQASKDLDRQAQLADEIAEIKRQIATAERALAATEDAAKELIASLPEPPEDFEAIRTTIVSAAEAGRLRTGIARAEAQLCSLLNTETAVGALADVARATETDIQAQLDVLAPELAVAQEAQDQAIAARARAEDALRALGGDDEAARLAQDRRTVLEELRASVETGLTRRLALMLSDRALTRYRERHRGTMLADTEQAFADLTGGAYPRLGTQATDKGDVLIAQRAGDGHSLRADEPSMSKGTRFQLYLALRLAGYRQMATEGTILPFLCDDVFETFDEARTAAACRLMHRIGEIGQALYFTHHAHVADIARAECGDGVKVHRL